MSVLLPIFFCLMFSFPSFASVATPAEATPAEAATDPDLLDDRIDFYFDDTEDIDDNELLRYILSGIWEIRDTVSSSGPAASSIDSASALEASEILLDSPEFVEIFDPPDSLALEEGDPEIYVNALRFDVRISGSRYVLLFPPQYADSIFIDSQKRLWNLSTSTIQGRIVGDTFNPYATSGKLVYLTPCLGNNFSAIYTNGSPNYVRNYYWSGSRLVYDDSYVEIVVEKSYFPFSVTDTLQYVSLFVLLGGVLLIWLRSFKNY